MLFVHATDIGSLNLAVAGIMPVCDTQALSDKLNLYDNPAINYRLFNFEGHSRIVGGVCKEHVVNVENRSVDDPLCYSVSDRVEENE